MNSSIVLSILSVHVSLFADDFASMSFWASCLDSYSVLYSRRSPKDATKRAWRMQLSDHGCDTIRRLIDAGQSLSPVYGFTLSADVSAVDLIRQGKSSAVTPLAVRFQLIEPTNDLSLKSSGPQLAPVWSKANRKQSREWRSEFIWGADRPVLLPLTNSSLHEVWLDNCVLRNEGKQFSNSREQAPDPTGVGFEYIQRCCHRVAAEANGGSGKDTPKALEVEL